MNLGNAESRRETPALRAVFRVDFLTVSAVRTGFRDRSDDDCDS